MGVQATRASLMNALLDYTRRTDETHRENAGLEEMLRNISKQYGAHFTKEQVDGEIYGPSSVEDLSAQAICNIFMQQEESIQRMETILGKNPNVMTPDEMELDAARFYSMTFEEYQSERINYGLDTGDEKEHNQDGFFLLKMLEKYHGKQLSTQEIAENITKIDHGLGDLHHEFSNEIKEDAGRLNKTREINIHKFRDMVKNMKHMYKKKVEEHEVISQVISEGDKVKGPEYKGSIDTGLIPVAMEFFGGDLNVILGKDPSEKKCEGYLWLEIYDINKDKSKGSVITPLSCLWGGIGPTWLNRGLNSGTDGLIYAVGDYWTIQRYDSDLREIDDKSGGFDKALKELEKKAKDVFPRKDVMDNEKRYRILEACEDGGSFYFITESNITNKPSTYVFKVEGNEADWQKLGDFRDSISRMRKDRDKLYVKFNEQIHVIDKNMKDSSIINPALGYIHPNHCLQDDGTIWTTTPYKEEIFPSLKGINQDSKHITHVCPTPLYSEQTFSTIAINQGSKLMAHSNLETTVALYGFKK